MKILTDNSWSDFSNVERKIAYNHRIIYLENGDFIDCTYDHSLFDNNLNKIQAYKLKLNDKLFHKKQSSKIIKIEKYYKEKYVYDVINVEKNNRFFANDILVSNCEEFWVANYPALSQSTTSKIIIMSTPNGMYNLFHKIYSEAEKKRNGFEYLKVTWKSVPGRDEKWAKAEKKALGMRKFNQEHEVQFLGSSSTVIDATKLEHLFAFTEEPQLYDLNDKLRVYKLPEEGAIYTIGVDPSKGTGEHDACMQIIKINSISPIVDLEQVAVFQDNKTDAYTQAEIVNRLSYYYNNAHIICENNGEGSAVVNTLWWTLENSNLYNHGNRENEIGIRSTSSTKTKAVLLMKRVIEAGNIKIYDNRTIQQLGAFIEKGKKFCSNGTIGDDLVDSLFYAIFSLELDLFDDDLQIVNKNGSEDDVWGILSDVDTDFEENWEIVY